MRTRNTRPGLLRRVVAGDDSGAALIVALLMLLGLASMGMAVVMISSTDFVVAGNQRQRSVALNVAEAGLSEAMNRLSLRPGTLVSVGGNDIDASIFDPVDPPDPNWTARIFLTSPGSEPAPGVSEFHTGTVQASGEYLDYSHASDANQAVTISHKLRDFDGDGVPEVALYDPSRVPPENPATGFPIERIWVQGRRSQAERTIQADVIRFPLNPNVFSSLQANGDVDLRGTVAVCGHNHRIDTPIGTQLPNCSPAWNETQGNLFGVVTSGGAVQTTGSTDLLGSPSPTSTDPANVFQTLEQALGVTFDELQEILSQADRNSLDGGGPWDGITYVPGDASTTGGTGSGLLYVQGDLKTGGNFNWTGLIYVEGQFRNTGNVWILGGVMVRGGGFATAVDFGAGTPAILYSRAALVQTLTRSMDYVVLTWKELE